MIRKQLYVAAEHQRKLQRLAAQWQCSEAEVVRRALDRVPEPATNSPDEAFLERLRRDGVLEEPRDFPGLPKSPAARRRRRAELEALLAAQTEPLGLSQAIIEDRG